MKATDILMEEHRVILRVIAALDTSANRLNTGGPVQPTFFIEAAEFIKGFADGCHHRKEEGVLFPAMVMAGLPADSGPIAVMLAEHEEGRHFTRTMRQAAERVANGETDAKTDIVTNALGYIKLLRQHIQKEDFILFPMAGKIIPPEKQAQVNSDFERIDQEIGEGEHRKYLALAERLELDARD
jgi:hemerythrin-like domain-containing protein